MRIGYPSVRLALRTHVGYQRCMSLKETNSVNLVTIRGETSSSSHQPQDIRRAAGTGAPNYSCVRNRSASSKPDDGQNTRVRALGRAGVAVLSALALACVWSSSWADSDALTQSPTKAPPRWDTAGPNPVTPWLHPGAWTPGQNWGWFSGDWHAPNATGSWGGLRDRLELGGLSFTGGYLGQLAANPVGGETEGGTSWINSWSVSVYADMEQLFDISHPLYFIASMHLRAGNSGLTPSYVGNLFPVQLSSSSSSSAELRLVNLALGARLFDNRVELAGGRLSAGDDFATLARACTSLNQSICGNPIAGTSTINFPSTPDAAWGARIKVDPDATWFAQGGAYLVYPGLADDDNHGVQFGAPAGSGVLAIAEAGLNVGTNADRSGLPGTYRFGGYYDTELLTNLATGAAQRNTWGVYAMGEQMIYRETGAPEQGLWLWLALSYAPPDVNEIQYMAAGGLSYNGLLPNRPDDRLSFIAAAGVFSDRLAGQGTETILELNYRAQILPALYIEPDIQYIINPDGLSTIDNALVVGFALGSNF